MDIPFGFLVLPCHIWLVKGWQVAEKAAYNISLFPSHREGLWDSSVVLSVAHAMETVGTE